MITFDTETSAEAAGPYIGRINLGGVVGIDELAIVLRTSRRSIQRHLKAGSFPIQPLPHGVDKCFRWYGPRVLRWLEENGR